MKHDFLIEIKGNTLTIYVLAERKGTSLNAFNSQNRT
jgi:hypothetical protein